jgi:hypothetical protein
MTEEDVDTREPVEAIVVETGNPNPLVTVAAWGAVVLVVFVMGWWVWTRWIEPPVGGTIAQYVDGGGYVYESPDDQFSVSMPTRPRRTTQPGPLGESVTVTSSPGDGYVFSVTKTPEPISALEDYEATLNQAAGALAALNGAEIVAQEKPFPFVDVAVKTIEFRKGDTHWWAALRLASDRMYTIVAKAPNDDREPYERLVGSFSILGPR